MRENTQYLTATCWLAEFVLYRSKCWLSYLLVHKHDVSLLQVVFQLCQPVSNGDGYTRKQTAGLGFKIIYGVQYSTFESNKISRPAAES